MAIPAFFRTLSAKTWRQLGAAFVLFAIPLTIFVGLASEVQERETLGFDEAVLHGVNQLSSTQLDPVIVDLTQVGGPVGATLLTAGIALLLWWRRKRKSAVLLAVGVGGAVLLNVFLKTIFQRDRPHLWERIVTENSYSFPSGHAMASGALAFSLIAVFWPTRWRWWVVAGAAAYMFVIGFTRLYLGVHYPTDIIAGWAVSAAWVVVVAGIIRYRRQFFTYLNRSRQRR